MEIINSFFVVLFSKHKANCLKDINFLQAKSDRIDQLHVETFQYSDGSQNFKFAAADNEDEPVKSSNNTSIQPNTSAPKHCSPSLSFLSLKVSLQDSSKDPLRFLMCVLVRWINVKVATIELQLLPCFIIEH